MNKYLFLLITISFSSCILNGGSDPEYSKTPVLTAIPFAEGIISSEEHNEYEIAFTTDGKTAYFTRRKADEKQRILVTHYKNGKWSQPDYASFSTSRDETPFISPDGETLYFGSERPIPGAASKGNFDMNIWKIKLNEIENNKPEPLPATINKIQIEGEKWPSSNENYIFSLDGETFYFSTKMRGTKAIDVYQTSLDDGNFSKPEKLTGFFKSEKHWIYSATISPDGKYLFFNSYDAPGGIGGDDIFVSKKTKHGWSGARALSNLVNTKSEEGNPRFSRHGKYFFFSRDVRKNEDDDEGNFSIFYIETKALELDELFKN